MIPKIIHYVWVGGAELNEQAKKCIESWKQHCPDYEIKQWDENNFDVNSNQYCKEAYEAKKWAFVSDYIRIKALQEYGGIYMDTDVELLRPLDDFLDKPAFIGFESKYTLCTAVIGCEKGNRWMNAIVDKYEAPDKHFIDETGEIDYTPNVELISEVTNDIYKTSIKNGCSQFNDLHLYSSDYFSPIKYSSKKLKKTENTYAIHWYLGSWKPELSFFKKCKNWVKGFIIKIVGKNNIRKLKKKFKRKQDG